MVCSNPYSIHNSDYRCRTDTLSFWDVDFKLYPYLRSTPQALPWNLHIYTLTLHKMKLKQPWCYVLLYSLNINQQNYTSLKYTPRFTRVNQRIPHKNPSATTAAVKSPCVQNQSRGSKGTLPHSEVKCHPDKVPKNAVKEWTEEQQNDPSPDVSAPPTRHHDCAQHTFTHALHTSLIWIFFIPNVRISACLHQI